LRPYGRRYALRDGDPAVERGCCINYKAPRVFFGPKTAHPYSGIPSPGTEQQRGQQVIYRETPKNVLKKNKEQKVGWWVGGSGV
jgi:hypothetical protein